MKVKNTHNSGCIKSAAIPEIIDYVKAHEVTWWLVENDWDIGGC